MGTYAQSTGYMVFKTFEGKQQAQAAIEKWVEADTDGNEFPVTSSADEPLTLGFNIESGRVQNLEWRLGVILDLVKPFGLVEFYGPVMMESEISVYWNEEDLEN